MIPGNWDTALKSVKKRGLILFSMGIFICLLHNQFHYVFKHMPVPSPSVIVCICLPFSINSTSLMFHFVLSWLCTLYYCTIMITFTIVQVSRILVSSWSVVAVLAFGIVSLGSQIFIIVDINTLLEWGRWTTFFSVNTIYWKVTIVKNFKLTC